MKEKGLGPRYFVHVDACCQKVTAYEKSLPKGMEASSDHVAMLMGKLHATTEKVRTSAWFWLSFFFRFFETVVRTYISCKTLACTAVSFFFFAQA